MLTRAQLLAIAAVLEVRLGWEHPLTQAVWAAHNQQPPETREEEEGNELVQGR